MCVLQKPSLLFPLPTERRRLTALLLGSPCRLDQPSALPSFQLTGKEKDGECKGHRGGERRELEKGKSGRDIKGKQSMELNDELQSDKKRIREPDESITTGVKDLVIDGIRGMKEWQSEKVEEMGE